MMELTRPARSPTGQPTRHRPASRSGRGRFRCGRRWPVRRRPAWRRFRRRDGWWRRGDTHGRVGSRRCRRRGYPRRSARRRTGATTRSCPPAAATRPAPRSQRPGRWPPPCRSPGRPDPPPPAVTTSWGPPSSPATRSRAERRAGQPHRQQLRLEKARAHEEEITRRHRPRHDREAEHSVAQLPELSPGGGVIAVEPVGRR